MTEAPIEAPAEEPTEVLTAFFVYVTKDGRVGVSVDDIPAVSVEHSATLLDLEMYGSQVAREAGRIMLAREMTPPAVETPSERVAKAITRRKKTS